MQCELLGAAKAEHVQVLIDLLTGLSGHPGKPINQQELTIKSRVNPFTELKLVRHMADGQTVGPRRYLDCTILLPVYVYRYPVSADWLAFRWEISHDGIPVKGKGYAELPAVVRNRTKAALHGSHSLSFWIHLGFSVSYELSRKGFSYHVYHDGFELQVCQDVVTFVVCSNSAMQKGCTSGSVLLCGPCLIKSAAI